MKKLITTLSLSVLAVWGAPQIRAEGSKPVDKQEHLEQRVEHLKKALDLTPTQVPVVESALKEKREKMEALRNEVIEKTKTIQADATAKINAVLSADQQTKFKAMQEKAKGKMIEHHENRKQGMMKAPK